MLIYKTSEITVRKLEKTDETLLVAWLSNPLILEYYEGRDRPHDLKMVREWFYPSDEETRSIVEFEGKSIGYIQSMVEYLVKHEKADRVVMDPQTWNERAIACYEKCGFKKVKLLKEHEKHEGQLRDVDFESNGENRYFLTALDNDQVIGTIE